MIKLILIILCFVVISGGFVCFCIVKASTDIYTGKSGADELRNSCVLYGGIS